MAIFREIPYSGMNFLVDIGTGDTDSPDAGVTEVILPNARLELSDYRSGNEAANRSRQLATIVDYEYLVLKRGLRGSLSWYEWWDAIRGGATDQQRTITIRLQTEDRTNEVLRWTFLEALPVNYHISPLNAVEPDCLVETLELSVADFRLE